MYDDDENESTCFERVTVILKSFGSKHARKAFFISFTSMFLSIVCGTLLILSYVTDIFSKTGSPLSANTSSLLISVTLVVGNIVFLNIVERFNRKVCVYSLDIVDNDLVLSFD